MHDVLLIAVTIIATFIVGLILFNLKPTGERIEHKINARDNLLSPVVMKSIGQLLGPPLISGNKITHLKNGAEIFPAMLEAIAQAKKTINFETFIYWEGSIAHKFSDAICERAKNGVRCHIILDWLGSKKIEQSMVDEMKRCGVIVEHYHPIRWYNLTRLNNRTHRKILVCDGLVGFTGGVGIADQWQGDAEDRYHWRDSHFKVEGPAVAQLQAAFMDNWNTTNNEVLHGDDYFPDIPSSGKSLAQVFKSSPEEGAGSVRLMYLFAIAHAKKCIKIANAYFVPDSHVRKMLIHAAKTGINIEVIVPGPIIDTKIARLASRHSWGEMLKAGIRIFEYTPTMYHCKYMIVDDMWMSVGSTNLDNRSFRLNDECNLNVIDTEWVGNFAETFEEDKARSVEITYDHWNNRPLSNKMLERFAFVFRGQI